MKELELLPPRSKVYKILSLCFCYPDQNFFRYAKGDLLKDLESSLRKLPYEKELKKSYDLFESALVQQLARFSLEELQVEHTGLFIYSHGGLSCSPYEAIYREENKRLMGESTMVVKQSYRSFKLRVSRQFADLPDHIAAELEFMHFLSLNEGKFATKGENQNRDLFRYL